MTSPDVLVRRALSRFGELLAHFDVMVDSGEQRHLGGLGRRLAGPGGAGPGHQVSCSPGLIGRASRITM